MAEEQVHIFGRKEYAQPLAFVETVTVAAGETPPLPDGDGDDWLEVIAFPASAVVQVIPRVKEKAA